MFHQIVATVAFLGLLLPGAVTHAQTAESAETRETSLIDATTLHHKVLCGYQGWFRCPGDSVDRGWVHWSRDRNRITPHTLTFEMWPEMSEYTAEEKFPAAGFSYPDGTPASLFSSAHPKTVARHFDWMRQYEIDGALVQRFVVEIDRPQSTRIVQLAAAAAADSGRTFALEYDLSGTPAEQIIAKVTADWKHLVDDLKLTAHPRYLHHDGRPVLAVWGFYPDRFDAKIANELIDFFKNEGPYGVTLIGGCPWQWRRERDEEWAKAYRRLDVISPWNVGNVREIDGQRHAQTLFWADDLAEARRHGMAYMPVVYPGFSWDNLKRRPPGSTHIPRLRGRFFSRQFETAAELGIEMVKVAMFDEVDEATAIFKISNTPPTQAHFLTLEGLPPDAYLRLTGDGSRLIREGMPAGKDATPTAK